MTGLEMLVLTASMTVALLIASALAYLLGRLDEREQHRREIERLGLRRGR